jgi:hypothetical protein
MYDMFGSPLTRTFALPKSHSLSWWVCGFTCSEVRKSISKYKAIYSRKRYRSKIEDFPAYQKILWLNISVADTDSTMNVSQCPTYLPKTNTISNIEEQQPHPLEQPIFR